MASHKRKAEEAVAAEGETEQKKPRLTLNSNAGATIYVDDGTGITWLIEEPARLSDFEIVQLDICAGYRISELDLIRTIEGGILKQTNSELMRTMYEETVKDGKKHIQLADGMFPDLVTFQTFWAAHNEAVSRSIHWSGDNMAAYIKVVHAMDFQRSSRFKGVLKMLIDEPGISLTAHESVDLGKTFNIPEMLAYGATQLATSTDVLPHHTLLACASVWRHAQGKIEKLKKAMKSSNRYDCSEILAIIDPKEG